MATAAFAQNGQWGMDNRLYSGGQATNLCRAPRPGDPTAFTAFDCRNRTPLLRIDMRQAATSGWVYGQKLQENGQSLQGPGSNFRFRNQGAVLPAVTEWYFYTGNAWVTWGQLAATNAPKAPAPAPVAPTDHYGADVVGGTQPRNFAPVPPGSVAGPGTITIGGRSSKEEPPEVTRLRLIQAQGPDIWLRPGGMYPSN